MAIGGRTSEGGEGCLQKVCSGTEERKLTPALEKGGADSVQERGGRSWSGVRMGENVHLS